MKKKILFTGGSGFIGHNVVPLLAEDYIVDAPGRSELDILDSEKVKEYVVNGQYDFCLHAANPNGVKNPLDRDRDMLDGSMRCFMNFYRVRSETGRLYFLGSGAEFDKSRDIDMIHEEEFDRSIPKDPYGFAKYIQTDLARSSENVYNLRIFGCYGPGDHYTKFITHCINCLKADQDITVRQDCYFDYMHVFDLAVIVKKLNDSELHYHDYNVCSGKPVLLSQIAEDVIKVYYSDEMKEYRRDNDVYSNAAENIKCAEPDRKILYKGPYPHKVIILNEGLNRSYTASNKRLISDIGSYEFKSLTDGIKLQIKSMKDDPVKN
ncbi:MAG: NAD-dependent epimerase/dehydratase family protein [Lachnospiraceae bacterium]|jgi:nucleoside-diphosphate-sugar epimerase|nr:NAD-dependent epimerase/dehydratase family protein [Lachnospiraceae bacterium]MEE3460924.1 NAD-dependent epimerase/dehydratase family protein [Lachnospiraceae bacterium]